MSLLAQGSSIRCRSIRRRSVWIALVLAIAAWGGSRADAQLIWPGEDLSVMETEHLRAYVPKKHAEELKGLIGRAEEIYAHMIVDAGYEPRQKLNLLVSDWVDRHNGFSFVTPFPLVQVELAPALTESTIFSGYADTERTLVHEFAHHISNDRNHGFRRGLEMVFGRILPNDIISLILFYLSTPAHQTMPRFWHEGLATWAETQYADDTSPWSGRGRDPLVHMVWRLDTAAGGVPEVGDWRISHHEWPYGNRVYVYGVAYLRYLQARLGGELSLWEVIREQSHMWPFFFNPGTRKFLGTRHRPMIENARDSLELEQQSNLAELRSAPVTEIRRWTERDIFVGAPAWLPGNKVVFSTVDPWGRPRVQELSFGNSSSWLDSTGRSSHALSAIRSHGEHTIDVEFNWRRYGRLRLNGESFGYRLFQPDLFLGLENYRLDNRGLVTAVHLPGGGRQEVIVATVDFDDPQLFEKTVIPTEGQPWNPTIRRGGQWASELAWVETTPEGSRLVLAPLDDPTQRTVLLEVPGRILHPAWSPDGASIFYCADHTGVANAYRLTIDGLDVVPVTNSIGGVIACVPSPDGSTLAVVEHDADGPYIGRLPNDPAEWAESVPSIDLSWPGPKITEDPNAYDPIEPFRRRYGPLPLPRPLPDPDPTAGDDLEYERYWGSRNIRPQFWMPTTNAAPYGGAGVFGFASDPLLTNLLTVGVGAGLKEGEVVGQVTYTKLSHEVEWGIQATRSERTFYDEVIAVGGQEFDYTETIATGEFRIGRGIVALERRFRAYGAIGLSEYNAEHNTEREPRGFNIVSTPAFDGTERYFEFTGGYGDTTYYPTSFASEDGIEFLASYRHSGLGGDLDRNLAFADAEYILSVWPRGGHQIVAGGQVGWSDGDRNLQGSFSIGGSFQTSIPRGYMGDTEAIGRHLVAYSIAYRAPVWRKFIGFGTTPFRHRQITAEVFFDAAKVSDDGPGEDGDWFRSVGGQLHTSWEAFGLIFQPGVGIAHELDEGHHTRGYIVLGIGR